MLPTALTVHKDYVGELQKFIASKMSYVWHVTIAETLLVYTFHTPLIRTCNFTAGMYINFQMLYSECVTVVAATLCNFY